MAESRVRSDGLCAVITTKGGLLVQLAKGCEGNGGVLVETHTDTLGGMVAEVKGTAVFVSPRSAV